MSLKQFLQKIANNEKVSFDETMAVISQYYDYQATEFSNGMGDCMLINAARTNEGSCKIFAFAKINQLTEQQSLNLFGDFYHLEVLADPAGAQHQNIRNFMQFGWDGIKFKQQALLPK